MAFASLFVVWFVRLNFNPQPPMRFLKFFAAIFAVCCLNLAAFAATPAAEVSPAGTWKWTQQGRQANQSFERKVRLEYKEGRLSGEILAGEGFAGPIPAAPIKDGSFKDGVVSFSVTREFNGTSFTIKYEGRLDGDTIKGSSTSPGMNGADPIKRDWNATREKEK